MATFVKPYNDDPFVGHLATPITSSAPTSEILRNLPVYRFGLLPITRGLEIGLAHGYFLFGPFTKLGPLRNSDMNLIVGLLSTIGLIFILTFALNLYGLSVFSGKEIPLLVIDEVDRAGLQTRQAWEEFRTGFTIGSIGSATFAYICLSSIPIKLLS